MKTKKTKKTKKTVELPEILKSTLTPYDTEGVNWTLRKFSHPERTIRIATSFSGISAPDMALKHQPIHIPTLKSSRWVQSKPRKAAREIHNGIDAIQSEEYAPHKPKWAKSTSSSPMKCETAKVPDPTLTKRSVNLASRRLADV